MTIDERLRADGANWRGATPVVESTDRALDQPSFTGVSAFYRTRPRTALGLAVVTVIAVIAVVIGVIATATGGRGPTGDALPTAPASTDPLDPSPPPDLDPSAVRPVRVLTTQPPGRVLSMPWRLASISNGGRTLTVSYVSGDGIRPDGVNAIGFEIIDTPRSVELLALSRNNNPDNNEGDSLALGFGTITLAEPLNGRSLLHAPTSGDWPSSLLN